METGLRAVIYQSRRLSVALVVVQG